MFLLDVGLQSHEEVAELKAQLAAGANALLLVLQERMHSNPSVEVKQDCSDAILAVESRQRQLGILMARELGVLEASNREATLASSTVIETPPTNTGFMREPKVQKFNGAPNFWPTFRDTFISEVHNRYPDNVTKLMYLQELCIGEASRTLGQWQPTDANYELAWDTLCARYNDEQAIIQAATRVITTLQSVPHESRDGLRRLIDRTDNALRQLSAAGQPTGQWDQLIISKWMECLPDRTYIKWKRHCGVRTVVTYKELRDFVEVEARTCDDIERRQRSGKRASNESDTDIRGNNASRKRASDDQQSESSNERSDNNTDRKRGRNGNRGGYFDRRNDNRNRNRNRSDAPSTSSSTVPVKSNRTVEKKCAICNDAHKLWACAKFRALSVADRQAEVAKLGACGRCLDQHNGGICKSTYDCRKCKGAHSTLLCNSKPQ